MEASTENSFVLPERIHPVPEDGLDDQFWSGTRSEKLMLQRCNACSAWQWGPEWICFHCGSFDLGWDEVPKSNGGYEGVIYSWERVWHPSSPVLADSVPYVPLLVSMPTAGNCRLMGNLVEDASAPVSIGDRVRAVFEHHADYTLVQWSRLGQPGRAYPRLPSEH